MQQKLSLITKSNLNQMADKTGSGVLSSTKQTELDTNFLPDLNSTS